MKYLFICLFLPLISIHAQSFQLQEGDLLFQDLDCGSFCEAIEKVTIGFGGADMSHVAMVVKVTNNGIELIEANGHGVVITALDSFLLRSLDSHGHPKVMVGRLQERYQNLIPQAILYAHSKLGASYDDVFDIHNDQYYCSELIYEAFKETRTKDGDDLFQLSPMTYIDPDTQKTFEIWKRYFKNLDIAIPEGEPGLNPGSMSRSEAIEMVHFYGILGNMDTGYFNKSSEK